MVILDDSVGMAAYLVHPVVLGDVSGASRSALDGRARLLLERLRRLGDVLILSSRMKVGPLPAGLVDCLLVPEAMRLPILAAAVGLFGLLRAQTGSLPVLDVELLPVEGHAHVSEGLLRRILHQVAEFRVHIQGCHVVGEDLGLRRPERRGLVRAGRVAARLEAAADALP